MPRLAAFNFGARKFGFGSLFSSAAATEATYIEDVFSTYLYTGNGSTQTITNGIDLAGEGGLVWVKSRGAATYSSHSLFDTNRGGGQVLQTDSTQGQQGTTGVGFSSTGFSSGGDTQIVENNVAKVSWTFRKQPKFFDIVTYTGTGGGPSSVAHSLGAVPGFVLIKSTSRAGNWVTIARNSDGTYAAFTDATGGLQSTDAAYNPSSNPVGAGALTATTFGPSWFNNSNIPGAVQNICDNGVTYVAYIFAHNAGGFGLTGSENVISCGSFTGSASGTTVNLGWEPQWVLIKRSSGGPDNWRIYDNMRGMTASSGGQLLYANTSGNETTNPRISVNATGFGFVDDSGTYGNIYIAIRRGPMKVPTSGTSVFSPVVSSASAGTVLTTGFPVDLQITGFRPTTGVHWVMDRLRGVSTNSTPAGSALRTTGTEAENSPTGTYTQGWNNTGFQMTTTFESVSDIFWNFRCAPGFFDIVCYTGNGPGTQVINHNLGVIPELLINKSRSARGWTVFQGNGIASTMTGFLRLNETTAKQGDSFSVSFSTFTADSTIGFGMNASAENYVTYLFASCPGVSKVGSYTGTGALQTINCGFTGGARFVLIKRTDSTGDWYVWDTARGIIAGNDPYLLLNTTAAEVTNTDYIDPVASGFEISSTAPAEINANGGTYIFLAIA